MSDPIDLHLQLQDDLYQTILNQASLTAGQVAAQQPTEEEEVILEPLKSMISLR